MRAVAPVCVDMLGETWAGYVAEGSEAGRRILITICAHSADSLVMRPLIEATRDAQRIRHPQMLAFLETETAEGKVAFLHEYLEGEPLSTLMGAAAKRGVPIPQGVALNIAKQAVDTFASLRMDYPRSFGHGGLCPETIFVAQFGEVMLRAPGFESAALQVKGFCHHPASLPYRSPEFLLDPREDEESSDVFSVGVVLWEMLTGRSLFGAESQARLGRLERSSLEHTAITQRRVLSDEIPNLAQVQTPGGALHPDVVRLVDWCLQREPALRPQTLEDLGRVIASLPPGILAETSSVAQVVRNLAGSTIDERHEQLTRATQTNVSSSTLPPSGFAAQEAKTAPARPRAKTEDVPGPPIFTDPDPNDVARESHPPAVVALPSRNRDASLREGWLLAAVALFAAGGLSAYLLLDRADHSRAASGAEDSAAQTLPPRPQTANGDAASRDEEPAEDPQAREGADGSDDDEAQDATRPSTAPKTRQPRATQPAPPEEEPVRPRPPRRGSGADGAYRPDGI